jgi:hypothetical protein
VARSSDEEASGPCDGDDISNSSLSIDGCDVQAGVYDTFVESVVSCSLLMLRSAILRLTSFPACD